jgi:hypothetical protein
MNFIAPEHDRWGRLMEYLVCLSVNYDREAPMPWRFKPPFDEGEPDYAARFRELEAMVQVEVESAITALLENGTTVELSEQAKIWLGIRVDACIQFAALLSTRDGFIPCPCLPTEQLARWLLLDWWKEHGPRYTTSFDPERYP